MSAGTVTAAGSKASPPPRAWQQTTRAKGERTLLAAERFHFCTPEHRSAGREQRYLQQENFLPLKQPNHNGLEGKTISALSVCSQAAFGLTGFPAGSGVWRHPNAAAPPLAGHQTSLLLSRDCGIPPSPGMKRAKHGPKAQAPKAERSWWS